MYIHIYVYINIYIYIYTHTHTQVKRIEQLTSMYPSFNFNNYLLMDKLVSFLLPLPPSPTNCIA